VSQELVTGRREVSKRIRKKVCTCANEIVSPHPPSLKLWRKGLFSYAERPLPHPFAKASAVQASRRGKAASSTRVVRHPTSLKAQLAAAAFVFLAAAAGTGIVAADSKGASDGLASDGAVVANAVPVSKRDLGKVVLPQGSIGIVGSGPDILEESVEDIGEVTFDLHWQIECGDSSDRRLKGVVVERFVDSRGPLSEELFCVPLEVVVEEEEPLGGAVVGYSFREGHKSKDNH
jgi:hypothetical protein